jgi:hypothetical protein
LKAPKKTPTGPGSKAHTAVRQNYAKGATKYPAKPSGMSGDKPRSRKGSPYVRK